MRVLTFLHSFEPGGVERVALRMIARWRAMGVDAPLFMGRANGPLRRELADRLDFAVPRQPRLGSGWWETLWMIRTLPAHIRRLRPDVLFCAGSTYSVVAVAMRILLRRDCPPIVAKISNDLIRADLPAPARLLWHLWLRIQVRAVDRWVVMDDAILADVATCMGPVDVTTVSDPAIDRLPDPLPIIADPLDISPAGTRYVSIGRLVAQKDHATLLAAFASIAAPRDRLTIIGEGPLRARLTRQAARLGCATQIEFVGHRPSAAECLRDHDVLVLSSSYEGLPAVLVEALAAGSRIVATDCSPGVRSLLADGRFGRLVATRNAAALAMAMAEAPHRPVDRIGARERAAPYTLDRAVEGYLAVFAGAVRAPVPVARPEWAI